MTDREVMQRVLANYDLMPPTVRMDYFNGTDMEALRTALAQPEPDSEKKYYKQAVGGTIPEAYTPAKGGLLPDSEQGCAECDKKQSDGWALYCVDCLSKSFEQSVIDPENQPSQYGTVSMREWVGLTDEEKKSIFDSCEREDRGYVAAMVEAKLKEKNT